MLFLFVYFFSFLKQIMDSKTKRAPFKRLRKMEEEQEDSEQYIDIESIDNTTSDDDFIDDEEIFDIYDKEVSQDDEMGKTTTTPIILDNSFKIEMKKFYTESDIMTILDQNF